MTEKDVDSRAQILAEIDAERDYQDSIWGVEFDNQNKMNDWAAYVIRYLGEALSEGGSYFRPNMVRVSALAAAAVETYDRVGHSELVDRPEGE